MVVKESKVVFYRQLPPSRPWSPLHTESAIFTSFPTGMPLPSPAVRATTLATKALRVRYSLRTTPLIMVLSSGIPDPENNSRAGDDQNPRANGTRKTRQTETDPALPSALTDSLWRDEVAETGRKQNEAEWDRHPHGVLQGDIGVQRSVDPLVGCNTQTQNPSVTTAAPTGWQTSDNHTLAKRAHAKSPSEMVPSCSFSKTSLVLSVSSPIKQAFFRDG